MSGTTRDTHRQGEEIAKSPAAMVDEEFQSAKVILAGAAEAVTFSGMGLADMADNQYRVSVSGKFANPNVYADEATLTEQGFDIINGAASEVAHVFIHGKIAGRVR
jgi:hypothetical protein